MEESLHGPLTGSPREVASRFVMGLLEPGELALFDAHLQDCRECALEVGKASELILALAQATIQRVPATSLRDKILAQTKPNITTVRNGSIPWEASPFPGIRHRLLFFDADSGKRVTMLQVEPGAYYPPHKHADTEHCYVLEGDLEFSDHSLYSGDFEAAPANSRHSAVTSKTGCTAIIVHNQRDRFVRRF